MTVSTESRPKRIRRPLMMAKRKATGFISNTPAGEKTSQLKGVAAAVWPEPSTLEIPAFKRSRMRFEARFIDALEQEQFATGPSSP